MPFGFELSIIAMMLLFNAVFAAYEMALASIPHTRIAFLVEEKKPGALDAVYMKDRMEASLAVIQLGITLVSAFAAATGGAGVEELLVPAIVSNLGMPEIMAEAVGLVIFIIPLTMATMIFGELVPKMFALKNKEWVILTLSPTLKFFARLSSPFIKIIEAVVRKILQGISTKKLGNSTDEKRAHLHDLKSAVAQARSSRVLGGQEERLILAAMQLTTRQVREIAVPASDIYTIYLESSLTEALVQAHLDMHTRFPVCSVKNDPQTIEGYVNFKDIIMAMKMGSGEAGIKGVVRPIPRVEEKMTISEVLEKMLLEKAHIALVVAEHKKIAGMITLEDVMEQLVGNMEDEYDKPSAKILPYGKSWLMGGGVLMSVVVEKLGLDGMEQYAAGRIPTLQDWCAAKIGHPLQGGEVIESDRIIVVPRKFRRNQMIESIVSLRGVPES